MKLKKILAGAMAGAMVLGSLSVVSAADSLTGSDWWTDCQTSTAISLADGESVSFKVEIGSTSLEAGDYAAFCVEATDGTNYFTATSDGDCWGAGADTDATSTGAVIGGIYMVIILRSGNNFAADIVDYSTGTSILEDAMYLEGTSEFGDTTCYIMTQVGNLEVSEIVTDSLTGSDWWTDCQTSTAISLADGETISFTVEINSDSLEDGEYAAFCVEANDGTNYFTATSDGDCWGAGTDTDGTSTGVVVGGSYTVTITRIGNNFTADIVDNSTGASILANAMYLEGTTDFGTTTCYIMTQVGSLTVSTPALPVASTNSDEDTESDTETANASDGSLSSEDSDTSSVSSDSSSSTSSSEAAIAATYFGTSSATAVTTITTTGAATYDDSTGYTAVEIDTTDLEEGVTYVIVVDDTAYEAYVEDGVLYIKGDVSEYDLDELTIYEADDDNDSSEADDDNTTQASSKNGGDTTPVIPVAIVLIGCAVVVFASKKRMA